jgi:egghead protein (zeste-white 4 protein)
MRMRAGGARLGVATVLATVVLPLIPSAHLAAAGPSLCGAPTVTGVTDGAGGLHYGVPGQTTVTVAGAGFSAPGCTASATIGPVGKAATVTAQKVTVDASGTSLTFTMPSGPGGAVIVLLTDGLGNAASSNGNFHFYALPTAGLTDPQPFEGSSTGVAGSNFTFGGTVATAPTAAWCDGSDPSMKPAVTVNGDTSLSLRAPSVYCSGPLALTFSAPYDSSAPPGADTPVTIPVNAGVMHIGAHVTGYSSRGPILPGRAITVAGNGFGPAGVAFIAGASAPAQWSDGGVTVTIPGDSNSGTLALIRTADAVTVAQTAVVVGALISSVQPVGATVGTAVTITGVGFGTIAGGVQFNGTPASVSSWSPTRITMQVPDGASTGPLTVRPAANAAPPAVTFHVPPSILSVTPSTGGPGTLIAIRGTGFGSRTGHVVFGLREAEVSVWTDHLVIVLGPRGVADGATTVQVATAGPSPETASTSAFTYSAAAAAAATNPAGLVTPGVNGKPVISTGPLNFTPPPQNGPVVISFDIAKNVPPRGDVPYKVTVSAFGTPVKDLKVKVEIALEPGADASITNGTTSTDANGQVHGFIHTSTVPGSYLLLATAGPYQNEVEISSRNVSSSSIGGAPFFVSSIDNRAGMLVGLTLLPLIALALTMSRGRVYALAGIPGKIGRRRFVLADAVRRSTMLARSRLARGAQETAWRRVLSAWWNANRPHAWRAAGVVGGVLIVLVYLLASISTLTALPLALGLGNSAVIPEGTLYYFASILVSLALTAIALRYVYYYRCWTVSRHFFTHPVVPDASVLAARTLPNLKVQITTKGGALPVVERSLSELERILGRQPWLQSVLTAEVITEVPEESEFLEHRFAGTRLRVDAVTLPADYETPNGTKLKARALHHLVELRRGGWNRREGRTFIVHFDEETLVTEAHLMVLVDYLSSNPRPVSQGPIVYPLEWKKTPWICRALESTRPFGCSECARVMENPPPPHLHGSNLVVDEEAENLIGWDFGTLDGQPFIAEDLLFGLRAFSQLGREAFGWHGATMMEQPPLSLHWAVQQRLRWVTGALQGLRAMNASSEYDGISRKEKRRLFTSIGYRIATYSLGFPVGFAGLYFLIHPVTTATQWASLFGLWRGLIIFSAAAWIISYQIGIARNLRYLAVTRGERFKHAAAMLVMTPVAGLCETVGPFIALLRWLFGARKASWTPTPKLTDRRPAPEGPTVLAVDAHGGEEVIAAPGAPRAAD